MSNVQDTSVQCFHEESENLKVREEVVLEYFRQRAFSSTAKQCMHDLGFVDGNSVKPRITELTKKGLLVKTDKRRDVYPPFKMVYAWKAIDNSSQKNLEGL